VNSTNAVLDSSAVLAVIYQERGADKLSPELLANAVMSSVNLAEVHSKLVADGWDAEQAWEDCVGVVDQILPFTMDHAKRTGSLILQARSLGLSLGDRACLALALEHNAPVYTADRSWKNLRLPIPVHVIR
jgi:PIN domain nuclease of toxin-antitoxin system